MNSDSLPAPSLKRRLAEAVLPAVLFLLLSAAFLWQPILTGKVFLPTDLVYSYDYMWRGYGAGEGIARAQNPVLSDVAFYYYPYASYAIERLSSGEFPLWNPYILTGMPFFATTQVALLDPINLLTFMTGPYAYWTWAALLRLAILGLTTFGFVRTLGRSIPAGMAAGVVLMACGFVAVWLNYSIVTTLAWMPALFWATTRMIQTGRVIWMAGVALCIGGLLLGGHPETQFLVAIIWGLYSLYIVARDSGPAVRGNMAKRLAMVTGAVALGLAVSAVQTFTFLDLLFSSSAISERSSPLLPFDLRHTVLRMAVLLYPNFNGTPLRDNFWVGEWTNFNEQTGYIGLLAMGLGAIGAAYWWRRDRLVPFFAVMVVLAVLLAIRAPGFHLVRALPVFNVGHGVRWVIVLSFFGAVLAGYGVDALLAMRPRTTQARGAALWLTGAALSALGLLLLLYVGIRQANWDQAWGTTITHVKMAFLFNPTRMTIYWPVAFLFAGAAVTLAWWRGLLPGRAMAPLLVLLLYADLWAFGSGYNPVTPHEAVYPRTETINYLGEKIGHERFVGVTSMMWPNASMLFGLRDMRGYDDVVDQPFATLYAPFKDALNLATRQDLELTAGQHRLLQVAGVRYILTLRKPRVDGDPSPFRGVLEEESRQTLVATYESIEALPRAHAVFSSKVAPDLQTSTDIMLDPGHDPHRAVVLVGDAQPLTGPDVRAGAVPITWVRDEPEEVILQATMPTAGYLVLSDNYAAGWEAEVAGQAVPILRANVAYRAVAVPAGTHTVRFVYRPQLFYGSAAISGLGVGVVLLLAVLHLARSTRKSPHR